MAKKTIELKDHEEETIPVATMCPVGIELGIKTDCLEDCESCEGNLHELCGEEALFNQLTEQGV